MVSYFWTLSHIEYCNNIKNVNKCIGVGREMSVHTGYGGIERLQNITLEIQNVWGTTLDQPKVGSSDLNSSESLASRPGFSSSQQDMSCTRRKKGQLDSKRLSGPVVVIHTLRQAMYGRCFAAYKNHKISCPCRQQCPPPNVNKCILTFRKVSLGLNHFCL